MAFTNKEMKDASQIAYFSILDKAQNFLQSDGGKGPYTVGELLMYMIDEDDARARFAEETGKDPSEATTRDILMHSDLPEDDIARVEHLSDASLDWKVLDVYNMNPENGFYACSLAKNDQDAIVAFRGSENMHNVHNLVQDWMKADFGLLNSTKTEQQAEAEKYADELVKGGLLDNYQNIGVTGHSLGGNLASHFTIACAENGREDLFNKITQCDNLDGPGFSEKYLLEHEDAIAKADDKITHYKWSAVGDLLNDLPEEKVEFLDIDHEKYKDDPIARLRYLAIRRHDTRSLVFDEEGKAKEGKQDLVSKALGSFSRVVDKNMPVMVVTAVINAAYKFVSKFLTTDERGIIVPKNPFEKPGENEHQGILGKIGTFVKDTVNIVKDGVVNVADALTRGQIIPLPKFEEATQLAMADGNLRTSGLQDFTNEVSRDLLRNTQTQTMEAEK